MPRNLTIAAAQLGPISRNETRARVVKRMKDLMSEAKARGSELVAFPELALTSFFPRWYMEDWREADAFFETTMPSQETQPLFDHARSLGLAFSFGYAELSQGADRLHRYNTSILVDEAGHIAAKYRKIHLPGHANHEPTHPFQHLEKRYFEVGDLGWPVADILGAKVGLCICNDRRWPETWRMMALQGSELALVGYNTPAHDPVAPEQDRLADFHSSLVMQAAAYQNCLWVVGVAKAGNEEGCDLIGGTCIIAPSGEIVARCATLDDELIVARCDLDMTKPYRSGIFNFERHRHPEQYRLICEPKAEVQDGSAEKRQ